jgi:hypothetical protein
MFSPSTCNFFMPFAQKDARFASAASRWAARLPRAQKIPREMKADHETRRRDHQTFQA